MIGRKSKIPPKYAQLEKDESNYPTTIVFDGKTNILQHQELIHQLYEQISSNDENRVLDGITSLEYVFESMINNLSEFPNLSGFLPMILACFQSENQNMYIPATKILSIIAMNCQEIIQYILPEAPFLFDVLMSRIPEWNSIACIRSFYTHSNDVRQHFLEMDIHNCLFQILIKMYRNETICKTIIAFFKDTVDDFVLDADKLSHLFPMISFRSRTSRYVLKYLADNLSDDIIQAILQYNFLAKVMEMLKGIGFGFIVKELLYFVYSCIIYESDQINTIECLVPLGLPEIVCAISWKYDVAPELSMKIINILLANGIDLPPEQFEIALDSVHDNYLDDYANKILFNEIMLRLIYSGVPEQIEFAIQYSPLDNIITFLQMDDESNTMLALEVIDSIMSYSVELPEYLQEWKENEGQSEDLVDIIQNIGYNSKNETIAEEALQLLQLYEQ